MCYCIDFYINIVIHQPLSKQTYQLESEISPKCMNCFVVCLFYNFFGPE